ncbi:MAG: hypothetical protein D6719_02190 [Candidatus Dadabacteria bacterium]|nr:MAG: hypothetical protein D6719_02190 [Candidatus Dadabacteria bacterium]
MKNAGLKLLSLLIAVLLSFFVHGSSNTSVLTLSVPVEVKNLPDNKIILLPYPSDRQAQVTFRGPSYLISRIAGRSPRFRLKAPENIDSRFKVTLSRKQLAIPPAVEVVNIEPQEFEFTLDDITTKKLPVQPNTIGRVPRGFRLEQLKVNPYQVEVIGPRTEVEAIKSVETYPVDLRDIRETKTLNVDLRIPGRYTVLRTSSVTLEVQVTSIQAERKFKNMPIELRMPGKLPFTVEPSTVSVEVSGPKNVIQKLKRNQVIPYVRIKKDVRPGEIVNVSVDLPKELSLVIVDPLKVQIKEVSSVRQINKNDSLGDKAVNSK